MQLGEDVQSPPEVMINDALIENNLLLGNSATSIVAPFQFKDSQQIKVRANTVVGDLPASSSGFRLGTEQAGFSVQGFEIRNNIFADPTGTITGRFMSIFGGVVVSSIVLERNLYWNAGNPLPAQGLVLPGADATRIEQDPSLPADQSGLVAPQWNEATHSFPSGATTIREEFLRLVEAYGALPAGSPAVGAALAADMPLDDIRGLLRDSQPDVGAYEHGAHTLADGGAPAPDAPVPDGGQVAEAGVPLPDGGGPPGTDARSTGCGCAAGASPPGLLGALAFAACRPRRSRRLAAP